MCFAATRSAAQSDLGFATGIDKGAQIGDVKIPVRGEKIVEAVLSIECEW